MIVTAHLLRALRSVEISQSRLTLHLLLFQFLTFLLLGLLSLILGYLQPVLSAVHCKKGRASALDVRELAARSCA